MFPTNQHLKPMVIWLGLRVLGLGTGSMFSSAWHLSLKAGSLLGSRALAAEPRKVSKQGAPKESPLTLGTGYLFSWISTPHPNHVFIENRCLSAWFRSMLSNVFRLFCPFGTGRMFSRHCYYFFFHVFFSALGTGYMLSRVGTVSGFYFEFWTWNRFYPFVLYRLAKVR